MGDENPMVIIAGHYLVDAKRRDGVVAAFRDLVTRSQSADGCIHVAITADSVDPERINNVEVWRDAAALDDGTMLFDWYFDGDTPSQVFDGFRLSRPSARVFDALAARVGAVLAGRNTYEDSDHFGGGSPHPTAPLLVLSHRPAPEITDRQTLVPTGIEDAVAAAREVAGDKDVCLMGGGVVTEALKAGLVDEVVLHQVPVLLGGGRPFFQTLPEHVRLRLVEAVPAPGVTHLHYAVER